MSAKTLAKMTTATRWSLARRPWLPFFLTALLALLTLPASAADDPPGPWSLRVGLADVSVPMDVSVKMAGTPVPGARATNNEDTLLLGELGYSLTPTWTARLMLGTMPTTTTKAGGSLTSFVPPLTGTIGKLTYAPLLMTATWQFADWQSIRPYVGGGICYTIAHKTHDADVANLKVDNSVGPVLQLGIDLALNDRWSAFADLRMIRLKTSATGVIPALGNLPTVADARLRPQVVHVGMGYRF